jgi:hypothetical protein
LALADLHPYTLAFNQFAQPGACKCRGMDEDVLPTLWPTKPNFVACNFTVPMRSDLTSDL